MARIITCWTKLTVPTSCTIDDSATEDGKNWLLATCYVNPTKDTGYLAQCFGRVTESPEIVYYITAWNSCDLLDAFEKSNDYTLQREIHAKFSSTPLETMRYDVGCNFWSFLPKPIGILDAYFPPDLSAESKNMVNTARGLVYHYAPWRNDACAYGRRPTRGWLHGTQKYEGQDALVVRFWHFWKSSEKEQEFKSSAAICIASAGHVRGISLQQYFFEQLLEAGALATREFHCLLINLPDYYREADITSEDDESEFLD